MKGTFLHELIRLTNGKQQTTSKANRRQEKDSRKPELRTKTADANGFVEKRASASDVHSL